METVNFQCGHCGNLLAVSKQYLGQQVRCPHCQQVVLAPSPPSPAAQPASSPHVEEHDSIFGAPATDDLFGAPPEPRIPPPHPVPNMQLDGPAQPPEAETLAYSPEAPPVATVPDTIPATVSPDEFGTIERQFGQPAPPTEVMAPSASTDPFSTADTGNEQAVPIQRRPRSRGWHIPLFIIPLISWAILATVAAALLYRDKQQRERNEPHPLEFVPDVEGDNPIRKAGRLDRIRMPSPDLPLPDHLMTSVGKTLRLGELEITADRVERGKISIGDEDKRDVKPEVEQNDALKLVLKLKNVSEDLTYVPMDSYFIRWWNANTKHPNLAYFTARQTPYTYLQVGEKKFYGGPAGWNSPESGDPREFVVGQHCGKTLAPGESMETFVCTDPRDPRWEDALKRTVGKDPVWRVHLRRGSVEVNGKRKPVTSVIGVTFKHSEIKKTDKAG